MPLWCCPMCSLSFPRMLGYGQADRTREGEAGTQLDHNLGYAVAEIHRLVDMRWEALREAWEPNHRGPWQPSPPAQG